MPRLLAILFSTIAIFATAANAADDSVPRGYTCDFKQGYSWSYEGGKFHANPPSELSFDIDNINLDKQSASLVLHGGGTGALKIVRALNANHYLEVVNEGFLNLTTIYDLDTVTGTYPAVHSRHFGLFGQPVFSQYAGICKAKPDQPPAR